MIVSHKILKRKNRAVLTDSQIENVVQKLKTMPANKRMASFNDPLFFEVLRIMLKNRKLCTNPKSLRSIIDQAINYREVIILAKQLDIDLTKAEDIRLLMNTKNF